MEISRYVAGYQRDCPEHERLSTGFTSALAAEAEQQGMVWGRLLHDWMRDGIAPQPEEFATHCVTYLQWYQRVSAELLAASDAHGDDEADDAMLHDLTAFSFHRLNTRSLGLWRQLFYGDLDQVALRAVVDQARFELSTDVMLFAQVREMTLGDIAGEDEEQHRFRAWHTGMLTEIDACIALLEATRSDAHVLVLPAPPQFERFAGEANADMLVIDTAARQAIGVQIKASHAWQSVERYDRRRIVMLDGIEDLQNSRAMRTDPRRSARRTVSWPGLVGAHYLRTLPVQRIQSRWVTRRQALNLKLAARHYVGQIADRNAQVFDRCRSLVLQALQAPESAGLAVAR